MQEIGHAPGASTAGASRPDSPLDTALLAFYGADMCFAVEPGTVESMAGGSAEDTRLRGTLTITGKATDGGARRAYLSRVDIG